MPRDGTKNLKPVQSKEEAKERGRKGGIKSGEVRRRKKSLKERMEFLINLKINDAETKRAAKKLGMSESEVDVGLLINFAQVMKAIKEKDTRAAEFVRDLVGEKPTNQVEVKNNDYEDLTPIADLMKITPDEEAEGTEDE